MCGIFFISFYLKLSYEVFFSAPERTVASKCVLPGCGHNYQAWDKKGQESRTELRGVMLWGIWNDVWGLCAVALRVGHGWCSEGYIVLDKVLDSLASLKMVVLWRQIRRNMSIAVATYPPPQSTSRRVYSDECMMMDLLCIWWCPTGWEVML